MASDACRIAEASGHAYSMVWAWQAAAMTRVGQGAGAEAVRWAEKSLELARREALGRLTSLANTALGRAYALLGRPEESAKVFERAGERQHVLASLSHLVGLTEAYLMAGHSAEALARAQETLVVSRRQNARGFEAAALRITGEAHAAQEPPDGAAATSAFREALTIALDLGMRPLAAQCQLSLGTPSPAGRDVAGPRASDHRDRPVAGNGHAILARARGDTARQARLTRLRSGANRAVTKTPSADAKSARGSERAAAHPHAVTSAR